MKVHTIVFIGAIVMAVIASQTFADWGTPVPVTELNTTASESGAYLSADGLTMYFDRGNIPGGTYWFQLYKATRPNTNSPFTSVAPISELAADMHVAYPWISQDGLRLYYNVDWSFNMSTRQSVNSPWSAGTYLNSLNSVGSVEALRLSSNELTAVFDSPNGPGGKGGYDMYIASRPNTGVPFGNIRNLSELNTSAGEGGASLSADGLRLYFGSDRGGQWNVYTAVRSSINDSFGTLQVIPSLAGFGAPVISPDGTTLLLNKNYDIYVSTIPEPATMALLALGGLLLRRRTR